MSYGGELVVIVDPSRWLLMMVREMHGYHVIVLLVCGRPCLGSKDRFLERQSRTTAQSTGLIL